MSTKADGGLLVFRKAQLSSLYCFLFFVLQGTRELNTRPYFYCSLTGSQLASIFEDACNTQSRVEKYFNARTIKLSFIEGALILT